MFGASRMTVEVKYFVSHWSFRGETAHHELTSVSKGTLDGKERLEPVAVVLKHEHFAREVDKDHVHVGSYQAIDRILKETRAEEA